MREPIDAALVDARMRDLAQTAVNQTISLFKGGIFALAAVLLLEIITQPEGRLLRLVLWLASFAVALISYNAWLNSSVIDFQESVGGIVLVIIQMMTELVLFAILTPRFAEQAWRGWVLVYGIFMGVTAIRMLFGGMNRTIEFDAVVRRLIDTMDGESRRTAWRMIFIVVVALLVTVPIFLLPITSLWPAGLSLGFGFLAIALAVLALFGMQREREFMEKTLREAVG